MNNNGRGIFSGIIGVATLIVAIIGATFAYFTANSTSTQYVTGTAATAGLNVSVLRMTGWSSTEGEGVTADTAAYIMVPQLDSALSAAIRGHRTRPLVADSEGREPGTEGYVDTYSTTEWQYGAPCIDSGGSLVCSIYKIVVQNTGSAPITVSGKIEFMGTSNVEKDDAGKDNITNTEPGENGPTVGNNKMNHLKWARLAQPESVIDGQYTYAEAIGSSEATADRIQLLNTTPIALLDYSANNAPTEPYQVTEDGKKFHYADTAAVVNQYLYGMEVVDEDNIDLLNGVTISGAHKAHFDIVDPTNDLTSDYTAIQTQIADGRWYLTANGNAGDTKIFYIAVWISENNETQNEHDQGQFTGMVTFNSSEGSGATSTFTQPYLD